jgi:hypothetical protein
MKLLGINSVGYDVTDQLLITSFAFVVNLRQNLYTMIQYISCSLKKAYDCDRMEVLYSILIEAGVIVRQFKLFKTCLNKICSEVYVSEHLSAMYCIHNGPKRDVLSPLLYNFKYMPLGRSKKTNLN